MGRTCAAAFVVGCTQRSLCDIRVFSLKKMSVDDAILWHLHVMELRNDILKHLSKKFGYPIQVRLLESTLVALICFLRRFG
jgi:hypothetical protein